MRSTFAVLLLSIIPFLANSQNAYHWVHSYKRTDVYCNDLKSNEDMIVGSVLQGAIVVKQKGAAEWDEFILPTKISHPTSIDILADGNVLVGCYEGEVLTLNIGSGEWRLITPATREWSTIYCVKSTANNNLYIGTGLGVFKTSNYSDWTKVELGDELEERQYIFSIEEGQGKLLFGSRGSIIWYDPVTSSLNTEVVGIDAVKNILFQEGELYSATMGDGAMHLQEYRSGHQWNSLVLGEFQPVVYDVALFEGVLYNATSAHGVLSENGTVNSGLEGVGVLTLASLDGKLYAGTENKGIFQLDQMESDLVLDQALSKEVTEEKTVDGLKASIFPNPAGLSFTLTYDWETEDNLPTDIKIVDALGRSAYSKHLNEDDAFLLQGGLNLDVSTLNKGMYKVLIISANDQAVVPVQIF